MCYIWEARAIIWPQINLAQPDTKSHRMGLELVLMAKKYLFKFLGKLWIFFFSEITSKISSENDDLQIFDDFWWFLMIFDGFWWFSSKIIKNHQKSSFSDEIFEVISKKKKIRSFPKNLKMYFFAIRTSSEPIRRDLMFGWFRFLGL